LNMSNSMSSSHPATLGLVLAGGLARRMGGGDKAMITVGGVTILDRVLARLRPGCTGIIWIASAPGDCPFLPHDLVSRLHETRRKAGTPLACARSGDWRHPVAGLWPLALREELRRALVEEGLHKIEVWTARYGIALAEWPITPVDPFFNVNTPQDAMEAERMAQCDTGESTAVTR
jgi:molybdenum cofactor guanylyltransferase